MKLSNRAFWAATFLAGCAIVSAGSVAEKAVRRFAGSIQAPVVRATRFELVDKAGRVRARIVTRPDGTVYAVGIHAGKSTAPVAASPGAFAVPAPAGGAAEQPPSGGGDTGNRALADQRRDAQLLGQRLEQERLRLEQDQVQRQQRRGLR
jgi:hypothetical protein